MYVRLKEEGVTPSTLRIEDGAAKGRGSQPPLVASAGLDDGEGGRAGVSPPPDPARVRAVTWLKQSSTCNVNVSQQGISLRYQGGNINERSGVTVGATSSPFRPPLVSPAASVEGLHGVLGGGGYGSFSCKILSVCSTQGAASSPESRTYHPLGQEPQGGEAGYNLSYQAS